MRYLALIGLLFFSLISMAQGLGSPLLRGLGPYVDSALNSMKLDRSDLEIPTDVMRRDNFRLSSLDELFQNPLQTFDWSEAQADGLEKTWDKPFLLYEQIARALDLDPINEPYTISADDLVLEPKDFKYIHKNMEAIEVELLNMIEVLQWAKLELNKKGTHSSLSAEQINTLKEDFYALWAGKVRVSKNRGMVELRQAEKDRIEEQRALFKLAEEINQQTYLNCAVNIYFRALDLSKALKNFKSELAEMTIETSIGSIHFGTDPPENCILIICPSSSDKINLPASSGVRVLIDRGGNDYYEGKDYCLGGAFFGIDLLIDQGGNDVYAARNWSIGSSFIGHGLLVDYSGDDQYVASTFSQGNAFLGSGLILDASGNDNYNCKDYSQAIGMTAGYGAILDLKGNDSYVASGKSVDNLRYTNRYVSMAQGIGRGSRPVASGGFGVLADISGNDNYVVDIYGQGSSYWYGMGALIDKFGNDNYVSHQYAQGSGIHFGIGILLDYKGVDLYKSYGVSQGSGHDYGIGGLLDLEGNDNYILHDLGQGGGNANSVSLFIDKKGNDGYLNFKTNTMGYSDYRRDFGMVGMFLDLQGKDVYGGPWGENNHARLNSWHGLAWDSDWIPSEKRKSASKKKQNDSLKVAANLAGEDNLELLFVQASASSITDQYLVEPARQKMLEIGNPALEYCMSMLDTEHPREANLLRIIFPKYGDAATPYLLDSLNKGGKTVGRCIYYLGMMGRYTQTGKEAVPHVIPFTENENYKLRALAYRMLGHQKDSSLIPLFLEGLNDNNYTVRMRCSEALKNLAGVSYKSEFVKSLDDSKQQVRYNVQRYLTALDGSEIDWIVKDLILNDSLVNRVRLHAIHSLANRKEIEDKAGLSPLFELLDSDILFQSYLAKVISKHGTEAQKKQLWEGLAGIKHPLIENLRE